MHGRTAEKLKTMADLLERKGDYIEITKFKAYEVAKSFDLDVVAILLSRVKVATFLDEVVAGATGNQQRGREVMTLLLDRHGDQITITEEVVVKAVQNWESSDTIMKLLFDRRGDQITITEEVIKAAAGNEFKGKRLLEMLLA